MTFFVVNSRYISIVKVLPLKPVSVFVFVITWLVLQLVRTTATIPKTTHVIFDVLENDVSCAWGFCRDFESNVTQTVLKLDSKNENEQESQTSIHEAALTPPAIDIDEDDVAAPQKVRHNQN